MKKYLNIFYIASVIVIMSSCDNFLTVESENQVTRESISEGTGFRSALNGVYLTLSEPELYGQELSFAMVSILGNNYIQQNTSKEYLMAMYRYDYSQVDLEAKIAEVWAKAYYAIANCNLIIQDIQETPASNFLLGDVERDLILAEARGLRGMMHLDLLRLFAPAPVLNPSEAYIPYVLQYPDQYPKKKTVQEAMSLVIEDLKFASENLEYYDTEYSPEPFSDTDNKERRFESNHTTEGGIFFGMRGTRLNYYAATALLARAYLYNGNVEQAYTYANKLYEERSRFRFSPQGTVAISDPDAVQSKLYHDIIFALYNTTQGTDYANWYEPNDLYTRYNIANTAHMFGSDTDDWRLVNLINNGYSLKWENRSNASAQKEQTPLIPVIRMSEIYYIMCEYLADKDLQEAIAMLQTLRQARGASTALSTTLTKSEFLETLYLDATREFIAEGQTFFLYKRLNRQLYNGTTPINMTNRYVLPVPTSENVL